MLKILCLHGFQQNSTIFHKKVGYLRTALKKVATLSCLDGPIVLEPKEFIGELQTQTEQNEPLVAWFRKVEDEYVGLPETFGYIIDYINKEGPFDGILGFSQGGNVTALLLKKLQLENNMLFKFAILCGGFPPRVPTYQQMLDSEPRKMSIPTLHIIGEKDPIILPEYSKMLQEYFEDPVELLHDGGHFLPTRSAYKNTIVDFVAKFMKSNI